MLILPLQELLNSQSTFDGSRHERNFEGIAISDSKSVGLSLRRIIRLSYSPLTPEQYGVLYEFFKNTQGIKCFEIGLARYRGIYRLEGSVEFVHGNHTTCTFSCKWIREINEYGVYIDDGIWWDKEGVEWDDGNVWL